MACLINCHCSDEQHKQQHFKANQLWKGNPISNQSRTKHSHCGQNLYHVIHWHAWFFLLKDSLTCFLVRVFPVLSLMYLAISSFLPETIRIYTEGQSSNLERMLTMHDVEILNKCHLKSHIFLVLFSKPEIQIKQHKETSIQNATAREIL